MTGRIPDSSVAMTRRSSSGMGYNGQIKHNDKSFGVRNITYPTVDLVLLCFILLLDHK